MNRHGEKRIFSQIFAAAAVMMLAVPAAAGAEKPNKIDGKKLFEQRCLKCHKAEKFRDNRSDRKGWELTLSRMERNSCILTDAETDALAAYLAKEFGE
jgi:mono/diheme cytochrome c family protein